MTEASDDFTDGAGVGTRERILSMLRRGPCTVEDLANSLHLTPNAVRVQLSQLERDDFVERTGKRPGTRKPSLLYGLTRDAERSFSRAYAPVLTELVRVLGETMSEEALRGVMRRVGEGLAAPHVMGSVAATHPQPPQSDLEFRQRTEAAVDLLQKLGASIELERGANGTEIRGHACPLGDVAKERSCVCLALERLLEILIGTAVRERCERGERPRCRFSVSEP